MCACVYMVDMCLHMERGTHRGNCFNIASRPREEKRKAIKAPWQEMILKIKFLVSGKLELKSEGGVIYSLTYNSGGKDFLQPEAAQSGRTSLERDSGALRLDFCSLSVTRA